MASIKKVRRNGVYYVYTVESHSVDGKRITRILIKHGREDDLLAEYPQAIDKPSHMPTTIAAAKASGLTKAKTHVHVAHLAMVVTAVLEQRTGLPASQLPEALSALDAVDCGDDTWRLRRSPLWDTIDEALGCALDQSWLTPAQIETWHEQLIEPESIKGDQPSA